MDLQLKKYYKAVSPPSCYLLVPAKLILPPPESRKVTEWAGWEREEE